MRAAIRRLCVSLHTQVLSLLNIDLGLLYIDFVAETRRYMHCLALIINFQKNRTIVGSCPKSVIESFLDLVTFLE